jgi:hypothetical protein
MLTDMKREPVPASYFNSKSYLKSDGQTGLLFTRQGSRLIAVPETLMESIFQTLAEEAGEASQLALYTFGLSWGKSFFQRTKKELEIYFAQPLSQMITADFFATMVQAWAVHGLGRPIVDFSFCKKGILIVTIENSGISNGREGFELEAGFLGGWFSAQTRQDLAACLGDAGKFPRRAQYLIGGRTHIQDLEEKYISKGKTTPTIVSFL